jgi:hypothetical protein
MAIHGLRRVLKALGFKRDDPSKCSNLEMVVTTMIKRLEAFGAFRVPKRTDLV